MSRTIGIEIEMVGLSRQRTAAIVHAFVGGSMKEMTNPSDANERLWEIGIEESIWTVLDDDTLRASIRERGELVTPKLVESDLPLVSKIVEELRGAGATVNSSCGLHIHVGIPTREVEPFNRLVDVAEQWEPLILDQMLPFRRQFAGPLDPRFMAGFRAKRPTTFDEFWTLWYDDPDWRSRRDRYDAVRYRGLNLHSFRRLETVEFRYFNGTVDSNQILTHVRSCLRVVEQADFPELEDGT